MKKLIYLFGTVLIISVLLLSCEKEVSLKKNSDNQLVLRNSTNELDESLVDVASIFSENTNNSDFKSMILDAYNEGCIEEFLLFDLIKYKKSNSKTYDVLNSLIGINPVITVAYPSFAFHEDETFDEHLSSIDYTVILIDDPEEVESLPAFNSNGELMQISSEFNENLNYCVIKYSEGEIAVNRKTHKTLFGENVVPELSDFTPKKTIGEYDIYNPADLINARFKNEGRYYYDQSITKNDLNDCDYYNNDPSGGGDGGGIDPREGCDEPCDRDCLPKTKDELHRVKFSSKKAVKKFESGWHLPRLELIAWYVIPKINSDFVTSADLVQKDLRIHWKHMTGKWSSALGNEIITWKNNYGDVWSVLWAERDYWHTVSEKYSIGFSAKFDVEGVEVKADVKYEVTVKKKDKIIGTSLIEYCDPAFGEGDDYKPYTFIDDDGTSGGFWFREHIR